jgi:hypothetical protein
VKHRSLLSAHYERVKRRPEQRRAERVPFFGCYFPEKSIRLDFEKSREGPPVVV